MTQENEVIKEVEQAIEEWLDLAFGEVVKETSLDIPF